MVYINYNKLWESEYAHIVPEKDKVQGLNTNQLKLQVHDTYKIDEKIPINFRPTNDSDVINKAYLDEKILKKDGHLSLFE